MDPQPNTAPVPAVTPGSKRRNGRSRSTNNPAYLPRQALRPFQAARRQRDLVEAFMSALGGSVSELVAVQIRKAAELLTMAEGIRAGALGGAPQTSGDLTALIRIEGEARRTLRSLGIKTEPPSRTAARVAELREARWAEQDRQKAAQAAARREASATNTTEPPDGRAA
jgi:hypothetical protein